MTRETVKVFLPQGPTLQKLKKGHETWAQFDLIENDNGHFDLWRHAVGPIWVLYLFSWAMFSKQRLFSHNMMYKTILRLVRTKSILVTTSGKVGQYDPIRIGGDKFYVKQIYTFLKK